MITEASRKLRQQYAEQFGLQEEFDAIAELARITQQIEELKEQERIKNLQVFAEQILEQPIEVVEPKLKRRRLI